MTKLALGEDVKSDASVMHRPCAPFYHASSDGRACPRSMQGDTSLPEGVSIMLDRMVAVTLGATVIALGAYAINEPRVVRGYLKGSRLLSRVLPTDDRVRFLGVALVLVAAAWVVFVLAVPLAAAPMARHG